MDLDLNIYGVKGRADYHYIYVCQVGKVGIKAGAVYPSIGYSRVY